MNQFTANLAGSLRRFAMAGVGAITLTVDKSREIINQLAARGEISAAEGQAACDELHKRLTEQVSAFSQKLRADYENLSFEQMLTRCEKLTPEQKLRLIEKLNAAAEPETAGASVPDSCEAEAAESETKPEESASAETAADPSMEIPCEAESPEEAAPAADSFEAGFAGA